MPTYEYKCPDGHVFDVVQRMTDPPVTECEVCGKPVQQVYRPVAVHFKGSGFYTTDYAKKKSGGGSSDGASKESGSKDSGSSSDSASKSDKAAKTATDAS